MLRIINQYPNESIIEKTKRIQNIGYSEFELDNGNLINIILFEKDKIQHNILQVINQYEENDGTYKSRYDVTILINGLPLVQIELKRRGVSIREAFNQINRYQRNSYWASSGLFEFVQLFIISNGTNTRYYSNTTREFFVKEQSEGNRKKSKKTSNSFEFTCTWADANNDEVFDLIDFTRTFIK